MADTFTTNLNLTKPELGAAEDTWGISLNADLDALDAIFSSSGTQINLNPNQVNFGDNKKAIFGAGSDLEIYHDGSNSYIKDVGTGSLRLRGTDLRLESSTLVHNFIVCTEGGGVTVYHNDSAKVSTTSSGINVTGTVTNDGLRVDNTDSIRPTFNNSLITISGGNATNSGANYTAFGGTHATLPNIHRWRVGGSEAARINALGNFGLGTSSPGQKLHVEGNVRLADAASIQFGSSFYQTITGTAGSNDLLYRTYANHIFKTTTGPSDNTDGTERMRVNSTGIDVTGTTVTDALTVESTLPTITLSETDDSTYSTIAQSFGYLQISADAGNTGSGDGIVFKVDNSEAARITSDGKLGLGTSSPSSYLFGDLAVTNGTSAGITLASTTSSIGTLAFADGTSGNSAYRGFVQYSHAADSLSLGTSGATALTIDSNKNVGIGTNSPYSNLDVSGASGAKIYYTGGANSNNSGILVLGDGARSQNYVGFYRGDSLTSGTLASLNVAAYQHIAFNCSADELGSQTERMRLTNTGRLESERLRQQLNLTFIMAQLTDYYLQLLVLIILYLQ